MRKLRPIVASGLLLTLTCLPALACLPNRDMTQAETACCKKMKGNCSMGAGEHSCCKTAARTAPVANVDRAHHQIQPLPAAELVEVASLPMTIAGCAAFDALVGLPPPAPPDPSSVLRI